MTESEALHELELRRCAAISAADGAALREVLTPDYAHVHATGRVDDLDTYIANVIEHPRNSECRDLAIRQYGDAAILIGDQVNTMGEKQSMVVVSRLAVRQDGEWRFASAQVARKVDGES